MTYSAATSMVPYAMRVLGTNNVGWVQPPEARGRETLKTRLGWVVQTGGTLQCYASRLVFISDGIVVGVIRRTIRSSENQTDGVRSRTLILLMTPSLRIKWKLHCRSRKQKWKNKPMPGFVISWFFRFCFRLRQPRFHWILSDGIVNGIGRNGNALILPTPIPKSLWLHLRLRFSIFIRS